MLVVIRPGSYAVELLLVSRRHQPVGRLGGDGRRCLAVPSRFLRVGHETVRGVLGNVCGRNRPLKIPPPIREGVPGSGTISDFVFTRVRFIDDLSFQQNGVLGLEYRCGIYRMLNPALNGFAHLENTVCLMALVVSLKFI